MRTTLWTLPIASTAILGGGVEFQKRLGRNLALKFSYEAENDVATREALVFEGVEAFRCTYYRAQDASMLEAYDRLVDCGDTQWLSELRSNLQRNGGAADGLKHMMISFDDGPCYEVVCRAFQHEKE